MGRNVTVYAAACRDVRLDMPERVDTTETISETMWRPEVRALSHRCAHDNA